MNYPNQQPMRATASPSIGLAVMSVVLGLIGFVGMVPTLLFALCAIIPLGFGIASLISGTLALVKAKKDPLNWGGRGLAIGGIIAGVILLIAPILYYAVLTVVFYSLG